MQRYTESLRHTFFPIYLFLCPAKGRIRFEASLQLGNASIFTTNENGKMKTNVALEKAVSNNVFFKIKYENEVN